MHRTVFGGQKHPKALEPFLPELRTFSEFNHFDVLHNILRYADVFRRAPVSRYSPVHSILALGMQLPEDTFVEMHGFDAEGDSHGESVCTCPLAVVSIAYVCYDTKRGGSSSRWH